MQLFALVDAASALRLVFAARRIGLVPHNLIPGELSPMVAAESPYLIEIPTEHEFLEQWADHWGKSPGLLLESPSEHDKLLTHLRGTFLTRNDKGEEIPNRLYKPSMLHGHLDDSNPRTATGFFGPVSTILVEGEPPEEIWRYKLDGGVVQLERFRQP
jgi:hypothetical protein